MRSDILSRPFIRATLGILLGLTATLVIDPTYTAVALFRVPRTQRYNWNEDYAARISWLQRSGLTEARLREVIEKTGLYADVALSSRGGLLRRDLHFGNRLTSIQIWGCCYELSYSSRDQAIAVAVVQNLIAILGDADLQYQRVNFSLFECPEIGGQSHCAAPALDMLDLSVRSNRKGQGIKFGLIGRVVGYTSGYLPVLIARLRRRCRR